jgi:outer membrane protein OmpA-like peptidoglycan-associated protein
MKKFLTLLVILTLSSPFFITVLYANSKSEAREEIREAKELLKKIERTKKFQEFIPYRNYHDAKVFLDTAIYQFEEEREYEEAALYAVLARIELETTLAITMTRIASYNRFQIENELLKELASKASRVAARKIAIIEAKLQKTDKGYKGILLDSVIFKMGSLNLTQEGIDILNRIYNILQLSPRSRIQIVGHTRLNDTNNTISNKKASAVSDYLIKIKKLRTWRINAKGIGKDQPMEINDQMRTVDRIEIIITGIR